jgi:phosphoglycolate phosphatase/beta-phosphoglucomutase
MMTGGCVIFDFDGVVADTENLHLAAHNQALAELAPRIGTRIELTPQIYFSRYVVYGNHEGFQRMLQDAGAAAGPPLIEELCRVKDRIMDSRLAELAAPLPGVRRLLAHLARRRVPCGICSGARRSEIEDLLRAFDLARHFPVIVAIEDVRRCKPDPEGYSLAWERLRNAARVPIEKNMSLVIEDTAGGAAAARAAGLRVLGLATSSSLPAVRQWADYVAADLSSLNLRQFDAWLGLTGP